MTAERATDRHHGYVIAARDLARDGGRVRVYWNESIGSFLLDVVRQDNVAILSVHGVTVRALGELRARIRGLNASFADAFCRAGGPARPPSPGRANRYVASCMAAVACVCAEYPFEAFRASDDGDAAGARPILGRGSGTCRRRCTQQHAV
jgi:hypothetical protein